MKPFFVLLIPILLASCTSPEKEGDEMLEPVTADNWQQGKQLFHTKCASCHMVNKELTGPALKGVESRWPDKEKLYTFIRNSEEVIKSDKYARELWLQYNQTVMLPQPDLTDENIAQILGYINSVSENATP